MSNIRQANLDDLARIAEIVIFNYRLNFYPIFRNDRYYFHELQVPKLADEYNHSLGSFWVYDDGAVKGFVQAENHEVKKLFVEPVLQGNSIGSALLKHAMDELGAVFLWALEKNTKAISFYRRHGFRVTDDKKLEDGTTEYLVRLERKC